MSPVFTVSGGLPVGSGVIWDVGVGNVLTVTQAPVFAAGLIVAATQRLYLDGGGDTYVVESSLNVLDFYSGGSNVLKLAPFDMVVAADFTISRTGAINAFQYIQSAAGQTANIVFRSGALNRWTVQRGVNAETGADAGSPFVIIAHGDAGGGTDVPFQINRAAGSSIILARPLTLSTYGAGGGAVTVGAADSGGVGFRLLRVPN